MTSNNNNWIADTVGDFIHSPIWAAPIHTFIEANCAAFDYDDDDIPEEENAASAAISVEEQMNIHEKYAYLVNALINCLGNDLSLDKNELNKVCELPTAGDDSVIIDESFEQLYAAKDFQLFQEMMRRKNLILQLQALVSLQLQWGLLKHSDTGDDLILSLLLQATASPRRRDSVNRSSEPIEQPVERQPLPVKQVQHHQNDDDEDDDDDVVVVPQKQPSPPVSSHRAKERKEPRKPSKEEYHLPGLRRRGGDDLDAEWYRKLQRDNPQRDDDEDDDDHDTTENAQSKQTSTPQTLGGIRNEVLRKKLHELTDLAASAVDDETAAAITSRKNFFKKQRELIIEKQRAERARDLEKQTEEQEQQQTRPARPQSAAHVARKAMATVSKTNENKQEQQSQIPDAELARRRAMAAKLKREVVDKR